MSHRHKPDSAISFRLEQPIEVGYKVVATPSWAAENLPLDMPREQVVLIRRPSDLDPVLNELSLRHVPSRPDRLLGADTESTGPLEMDGLDPVSPSSRIVCAQIGTLENIYIFDPGLLPRIKPVLESEDVTKILQNSVHDYRFLLAKYGIEMQRIYCTMLAEQILTAGRQGQSVGLTDLVRKYPPHYLITKNVRDDFIQFSGRLTREMLYYAARDIKLLFHIYRHQYYLLRTQGLIQTARLEFDCISAAAEMNLNGVFLDETYLRQLIDYCTAEMQSTVQQIYKLYNEELAAQNLQRCDLFGAAFETFNISSNPEKKAALWRIGIEVDDVDYDSMERLKHPIGKLFCKWSGLQKILSTYGQAMLDRRHWHTRRIHPKMDQLGAGEAARLGNKVKSETIATGRWSGDMQQLPRPEHFRQAVSPELDAKLRRHFAKQLAALGAA